MKVGVLFFTSKASTDRTQERPAPPRDTTSTEPCRCALRRLPPEEGVRSAPPHYSSSSSHSSFSPRSRRRSSSSSSTSNTHNSSKLSGYRPGTSSSRPVRRRSHICQIRRLPGLSRLGPCVLVVVEEADSLVHHSHRTTSVLLDIHLSRLYLRRLARRLPLPLSNGREVRHPGRDRLGNGCLRLRPRLRQGDGGDACVSLRIGGGGCGGRQETDLLY